MGVLALDIGGAYLKAADGLGYADSQFFPLWKNPDGLADALARVVEEAPPADRLVATMTGELADCYNSKAEGVAAILAALGTVPERAKLGIYLTDGLDRAGRRRPIAPARGGGGQLARAGSLRGALRSHAAAVCCWISDRRPAMSFPSWTVPRRPSVEPIPSACCTASWSTPAWNAAPSAPWPRPFPGAGSSVLRPTKCSPPRSTRI